MLMSIEPKKRDVALVVDDSPETLRLLTDALDGAGMTVMVALDGASAMRIVDQITPDIVLLDAVMPGLDGFETCRRLKRDAGLANVPVIFMTGLAETEHIVRGLEAGGVDYVTKPIVIEEMLARIRVHLGNARLTQSARAALDVHLLFELHVTQTHLSFLDPPGGELGIGAAGNRECQSALVGCDDRNVVGHGVVTRRVVEAIGGRQLGNAGDTVRARLGDLGGRSGNL